MKFLAQNFEKFQKNFFSGRGSTEKKFYFQKSIIHLISELSWKNFFFIPILVIYGQSERFSQNLLSRTILFYWVRDPKGKFHMAKQPNEICILKFLADFGLLQNFKTTKRIKNIQKYSFWSFVNKNSKWDNIFTSLR